MSHIKTELQCIKVLNSSPKWVLKVYLKRNIFTFIYQVTFETMQKVEYLPGTSKWFYTKFKTIVKLILLTVSANLYYRVYMCVIKHSVVTDANWTHQVIDNNKQLYIKMGCSDWSHWTMDDRSIVPLIIKYAYIELLDCFQKQQLTTEKLYQICHTWGQCVE